MTTLAPQNLTTGTGGWRQLMNGLGILLLLGGSLFAIIGMWEIYQLRVRSTAWPAVKARIVKCSVSGSAYYSSFRHSPGESSFVRCEFNYQADGSSRQNTVDIGNTVFTPQGRRTFLASGLTEEKMRDWVARHPAESFQTIHYNPGNPNEISLPEAEEELSSNPPAQKLWFGLGTTFFGMLVVAIGKVF